MSVFKNMDLVLRTKWHLNQKGYIQGRVYYKDGSCKQYKQHRFLMEMYLNRYLLKNEDVHHINENKNDNRIVNLKVLDHSEHTKTTNKRSYKKGYKMNLTDSERKRRSDRLKAIKKATTI